MKQAVIFDMDGTLIRTELILEESLNLTLQKLDTYGIGYIERPMERYNEIMGVTLEEVWRNLLLEPTDENIEQVNGIFQNALISCIRSGKSRLYDHVEDILEDIKSKGYDIFIASNGDEDYLKSIHDYHGLEKYIAGVYSINRIESSNKSDLFRHIMEKENVDPKFIVGDRLSDFMAGRDNDIESIGCRFYYSKEEELAEADYIAESLNDLKKIVQ